MLRIEGRVIENKDLHIKDAPVQVVMVRLANGETTGVTLPKDAPVRPDAAIKVERHRKALGPVKIEWDDFGGFIEPVQ